MANNSYSCSQAELYIMCRTGWNLCRDNLAAFAAYKPKYTEGFVAQNISDINAADGLDDAQARFSGRQNLRIDLVEKKDDIISLFVQLKGYITDAYRTDKVKNMTNAAGQAYFKKAKSSNWTSVTALLSSAIPFITNHTAELSANNNMPSDFLTKFQATKLEFEEIYEAWKLEHGSSSGETDKKLAANNDIFSKLKTMLSDAQIVFRKDSTMQKKFRTTTLMPKTRLAKSAETTEKTLIKPKRNKKTDAAPNIEASEMPQMALEEQLQD